MFPRFKISCVSGVACLEHVTKRVDFVSRFMNNTRLTELSKVERCRGVVRVMR